MTKHKENIILPDTVRNFLQDVVWEINPKFRIRNKAHPTGLYSIARVFIKLFNKEIDTRYITVINGECWFPSSYFSEDGKKFINDSTGVLSVLAHESVHELDRKRLGTIPFTALYLFPQILAVFSLLSILAVWNLNWLWCLLFLLCLTPLPAPGRVYLETRGYKMNMSFARIRGLNLDDYASAIITQQFTSPAYYFMAYPWSRGTIKEDLTDPSHENDEEIYTKSIEWIKNLEQL